ncbi:MAG: DNA-3-methyladenine glycosylase 2 family protein, partial [Nostocoides sp.]
MTPVPPLVRRVRLTGPYSLSQTVGALRHGGSDPTCRVVGGVWWFGQATPDGPASLALWWDPSAGEVCGAAWGPGAAWSLDRLPALTGAHDDRSGFVAHDELASAGLKANPGWRIPASGLVVHSLIAAIIEQRVTGKEAFASQARLIRRFGSPAPGEGAAVGLFVPPAPREWGQIPSWEWIGAGVDRARSGVAVRVS